MSGRGERQVQDGQSYLWVLSLEMASQEKDPGGKGLQSVLSFYCHCICMCQSQKRFCVTLLLNPSVHLLTKQC